MNDQATTDLQSQLDDLQVRIRADAGNPTLRVHLFQLLCIMGNWTRALAQLQLCGQMQAKAIPMAQTYREAIGAEMFRREVFAGRRAPQVLGKPPAWTGLMIEALACDARSDGAGARRARAQALEMAEPVAFDVDGSACEWLMDGDGRIGPVCEIIANGQYYWMPFESCAALHLEPPSDLRDLVWATGELILDNEGRVPVLIPARYPGTDEAQVANADALKMSRLTEWLETGPDLWIGLGQRMWNSDNGEHPILDTRRITRQAST